MFEIFKKFEKCEKSVVLIKWKLKSLIQVWQDT